MSFRREIVIEKGTYPHQNNLNEMITYLEQKIQLDTEKNNFVYNNSFKF